MKEVECPARAGILGRRSRPRRRTWIVITWIIALALLITLGAPAVVAYRLTHPTREALYNTPRDFGLEYRDVTFPSQTGDVALKGWFLPASGGGAGASAGGSTGAGGVTVVVSHGYSRNRLQKWTALPVAAELVARGYNVLLFDYRAHGESGGSVVTVGEREKHDLAGAIAYARSLGSAGGAPAPRIAVLGYSMGAATAIVVTAETPDVELLIADSAFSDLTEYLEANLSVWSRLPRLFFTPFIMWLNRTVYGIRSESVSPRAVIGRIAPRPILFIHGKADQAIPWAESEKLFRLAPGPRNELFVVEGADHVEGYKTRSREYLEKVGGFLDRHFRRK